MRVSQARRFIVKPPTLDKLLSDIENNNNNNNNNNNKKKEKSKT